MKDTNHYPIMRCTELEFYQKNAPFLVENPPASTIMGVNLGKPEYLIEIEVVGVISREWNSPAVFSRRDRVSRRLVMLDD